MVFEYHRESDMLYIRFQAVPSTESEEVAPGVVLDYDSENRIVGMEIEDASKLIDLTQLELNALPLENLVLKHATQVPA